MVAGENAEFFDLNIEEVLEHWPVQFAIREVIANALDEAVITGTAEPVIGPVGDGAAWRIHDDGRGLKYQHLTQNEDDEKRSHPGTIGQFGMGLKDALAVFDRRGVAVQIRSPHADISTIHRAKQGFPDIETLHAVVTDASQPDRCGTDIVLAGVTQAQVDTAKRFFLRYSADELIEKTRYGQVLAKPSREAPGRIYVRGILVNEEPNFLFSYNITDLNKPLRAALNRERTNVGRTAYTERVKSILQACSSEVVASRLTDDLQRGPGDSHDELTWVDVAVHACRVLATHEKVLFVTAGDLAGRGPHLEYARSDGYRLITVPDKIAVKLTDLMAFNGEPLMDLAGFTAAFNDAFEFNFVDVANLTDLERAVFNLTPEALTVSRLPAAEVPSVFISETMQLGDYGADIKGVYESAHRRIVIKRDQLQDASTYLGTLLHEMVHAVTPGALDGSLKFEDGLTRLLGVVAESAVGAGDSD